MCNEVLCGSALRRLGALSTNYLSDLLDLFSYKLYYSVKKNCIYFKFEYFPVSFYIALLLKEINKSKNGYDHPVLLSLLFKVVCEMLCTGEVCCVIVCVMY